MRRGLIGLVAAFVGLAVAVPVHATVLNLRISGWLGCLSDGGFDVPCRDAFFTETGTEPTGYDPVRGRAAWTIDFIVNTATGLVPSGYWEAAVAPISIRMAAGDFRANNLSGTLYFGSNKSNLCDLRDGGYDPPLPYDGLQLVFGNEDITGAVDFCGKDIFNDYSLDGLAAADFSELKVITNIAYCQGEVAGLFGGCGFFVTIEERVPEPGTLALLSLGLLGLGLSRRRVRT